MRILHIDTERTWRGGEQQMCYLAQGLVERGHTCHVVVRPKSECGTRARTMGLDVHPLPIRGDIAPLAARRLARLADEVEADILHAHTSRAHLACVMAKGLSRRHLRVVVHRRVDFSIHKLPFGLSGLKYRGGVDRYIAVTAAVKEVMIRDGIAGEKISVIYSGTDLSRFEKIERVPGLRDELRIPDSARVVGNVGFLVDHKDHDNLLNAAAIVLKQFPDAFFVVIGEGDLREQLEAKAADLGIEERVSFPGFRGDVPQCLKEFDVFCLSSWGEGIGGVILEAMASHLPVVTTNAGGIAEVVENGRNGILVPTRDAKALAAGIMEMLGNPREAQRMAETGVKTVQAGFTVERMVEKTLAVYENVLSTG